LQALFELKKDESREIVALNSLTATGIEKMILVIRDKQVLQIVFN
jgi:hypothetical protein